MITVQYVRSSAVAAAPMTVGCPRCLAGRGSYCKSTPRRASSNGYQNSAVGFHKARKDAIAHLSEQQRYDAYAAMRAEEAQLREQVSRTLAQPRTAEQQQIRTATGEAWRRAGREATAELRAVSTEARRVVPIGIAPLGDLAAARVRRAARRNPTGGAA